MKSKSSATKPSLNTHPVYDEPAFLIEDASGFDGNALVIADLHFGIEHSLVEAGAHLPSQTDQITERILDLCSKFSVSQLIILGDVKHTVPSTSRQEWYELPIIFKQLARAVETVEIVPGNHDGNLRKLIPSNLRQVHVHPNSGTVLHGLGIFHGHTWPDPKVLQTTQVLMAHNHPNILFVDRLGGRVSYACWLRCRLVRSRLAKRYPELVDADPEIVIMPAFNDVGSGTPVNIAKPQFLGPMLRNQIIDVNKADIHLADGTALGKLKDLIEYSSTKVFDNLKKMRR